VGRIILQNVDMLMRWWRGSTLNLSKKLYDNLRRLGVINGHERFTGDVDVEGFSSFIFDETAIEYWGLILMCLFLLMCLSFLQCCDVY
jgi:hypothetical protein